MSFNQTELGFDTVIIRFAGEIGVKAAWTRKLYERLLIDNIKAVLKHYAIPYQELSRRFGRLYLKTSASQKAALKLSKVFGISSVSPALETTSKLSDITDASVRAIGATLRRGNSFAVRCRRIGNHPYTSQDVCREVGRQILSAYPKPNLQVDLKNPDKTLGVEVRENKSFIFTDTVKAEGGLPLGTQPRLVCLLKGDLNSTLACWLTMKRGCPPVLVHFDNSSVVEKSSLDSVLTQVEALSEWMIGFPARLTVVSNSQNLAEIGERCPKDLTNLLCKRLMFRISLRIADKERAEGIVTGENIGDNNGLTPHDFRVEDEAVENYPIYRPIQAFEKSEIEQLAQKLGIPKTFIHEMREKRARSRERVAPVNLDEIKQAEENLSMERMIDASLNSLRTLNRPFSKRVVKR